ncbi:MAG: molybdopterin-dependent oxidoreductase, partial [Acidimicrobiia bacterium]|nr:molybdopterin-dependent oxidoreductase [Acidimicrobiia bacterium]
MGFFDRQSQELEKRGLDPERLPPGQYFTERFPVLHAGVVPDIEVATWDFTVDGLVGQEHRWSLEEFKALPAVDITTDIHCVTKWSKFDTEWRGVPTTE